MPTAQASFVYRKVYMKFKIKLVVNNYAFLTILTGVVEFIS